MARWNSWLAALALVLAIYNLCLLSDYLQTMQQRHSGPAGMMIGRFGAVVVPNDHHQHQQPHNDDARPTPPLQPDVLIDPHDSFSSCLLWMDDNFRLPEWIAYHYYMMNLRYLVIHTDPNAKTSPDPMLERWKHRMTIVVWRGTSAFSNETYFNENDPDLVGKAADEIIKIRSGALFRRQVDFFKACAMHLRSEQRKWVSFHDSDEFIVVTPQANVTRREMDRPGIIPRIVNRYSREMWTTTRADEYNQSSFEQFKDWDLWFSAKPCVVLPRALFSAIPSNDNEVSKDVPSFLNARQFDTFSWRYQGSEMLRSDGPGKAIVDVSRLHDISPSQTGSIESPHRPFGNLCTHSWPTSDSMPLLIHHYLGSWEAFSYRDDVRKGMARTIEKWRDQSVLNLGGINDGARAWIRGFVSMVGDANAKELLKGAGLPPGQRKSYKEMNEWSLKGRDNWDAR